jgi:tRNA(Ile)-lysidine synthetase-like protein
VPGIGHKRLKKIWQENAVLPAYERDQVRVVALGSLVLAIPDLDVAGQTDLGGMPLQQWVLLIKS